MGSEFCKRASLVYFHVKHYTFPWRSWLHAVNMDEAPTDTIQVSLSYRGKTHDLELASSTSVEDLHNKIEPLTGVAVANQKLICKGKTLLDPIASLVSLVGGSPGRPGGRQVLKVLLVGSTSEELEAAERAAKARVDVRIINDLSADRLVPSKAARAVARTKHCFLKIEVLPDLPEQQKARAILQELAEDPGVLHVLQKHNWTVGALCELYPEGYVGVSDVCVMGLNQNKGEKILLRLRTDDLQGFRKVLSIREVLYHELAHNEHGDHDDDFYRLMRQIKKEVTEFNNSGRALGGSSIGPVAMHGGSGAVSTYEGGGGRLGGASEHMQGVLSARELAASAAAARQLSEEEKRAEEGCGCNRQAKRKPHDPSSPVVQLGTQHREVIDLEPLPTPPPPALHHHSSSPPAPPSAEAVGARGSGDDAMEVVGAADTASDAVPSTAHPAPYPYDSQLHEMLSMGFTEELSRAALDRVQGALEAAVTYLINNPDLTAPQAAPPTGAGIAAALTPEAGSRQDRVLKAVAALAPASGDGGSRAAALETIRGMVKAILENPHDAKYRRIRLNNAKFQRTVAWLPPAMELLRSLGFEERGEFVALVRDDPGLLWLGKSALEDSIR